MKDACRLRGSAIALMILDNIKERIEGCEYSDDEILGVICGLDAKARGYVNPKDLLTYDKAMRMLGIKSKKKLSSLCRENGISNVRINNMSVGFRREDIERLYDIANNSNH